MSIVIVPRPIQCSPMCVEIAQLLSGKCTLPSALLIILLSRLACAFRVTMLKCSLLCCLLAVLLSLCFMTYSTSCARGRNNLQHISLLAISLIKDFHLVACHCIVKISYCHNVVLANKLACLLSVDRFRQLNHRYSQK